MIRRFLIGAFAFAFAGSALAQSVTVAPYGYVPQSVLITNTGANSWVVPAGVSVVYVDAVGAGGPGGGGQVTSGSGGGGGGSGAWTSRFPLSVTPGETLTITIPAAATGGAIGASGSAGGNLTITGADTTFPTLAGGLAGAAGAAGVGGASGAGGGVVAAASQAAATNGTRPTTTSANPFYSGGASGAGGGSTASVGGFGPAMVQFGSSSVAGSPGSGNASGGAGAGSLWGYAGSGGGGTSPSVGSAPSVGYGGGGGGGGPNFAGGGSAQGFARIAY